MSGEAFLATESPSGDPVRPIMTSVENPIFHPSCDSKSDKSVTQPSRQIRLQKYKYPPEGTR
jgi:hypothetical protein